MTSKQNVATCNSFSDDKNIQFNISRLYNIAKKNAPLHIVTPKYPLKSGRKKLLRRSVESDWIQKTKESDHANI